MAEEQQREQVSEHVSAVHQRERDLREAELILVNDIERSEERAAGKGDADHGGNRRNRRATGPLGGPLAGKIQ